MINSKLPCKPSRELENMFQVYVIKFADVYLAGKNNVIIIMS